MRQYLIDELVGIWNEAENHLVDHEDQKALELKEKFSEKCDQSKLSAEEIKELKEEIEGISG